MPQRTLLLRLLGGTCVLLACAQGWAAPSAPAPSAGARAELRPIRDVRFERLGGRRSGPPSDRVVIALDDIPPYEVKASPSGRLRLELRGVRVPEKLARTFDVTDYRGPLRTVSAFTDTATGVSIVEVERVGAGSQGNVTIEGPNLVWSFPLDGANATPTPTPTPTPTSTSTSTSTSTPHDGGPVRQTVTVARETTPVDPRSGAPRYVGRRIDLDLKDADIHNVLRLLADVGRVNIVTGDDVQGNVTIRMHHVPWDQALDAVLQAKGLGMARTGNLIRVAPQAQLQKERELRLAQQKQEYELTPLETRLIPVSYAQASEIQPRAKELLSPRGSIAVDERTNVLVARDIPGNLTYVEELVRSLDTQTPQVLVEARIVEASSQYMRDVGIQWGGDLSFGPATGNATGIAFPSSIAVAGGATDGRTPTAGLSPAGASNPNFAVNLPANVGTGTGGALGLSLGSVDNVVNLGVRLSAAESSGLVRIVSSPRILTLDNREARINQGTLIPYSQVSALGVQTTFQEAKLQLLVRPHVTADGSVAMHVKISRDEPDFAQTSPRGDPTIMKREAETDLLVNDGRTAVIGGIFTRNTGRNLDQVPFFGDIPILGVLFQRRRANDARSELVIFLTPRIVNRSEALGR